MEKMKLQNLKKNSHAALVGMLLGAVPPTADTKELERQSKAQL